MMERMSYRCSGTRTLESREAGNNSQAVSTPAEAQSRKITPSCNRTDVSRAVKALKKWFIFYGLLVLGMGAVLLILGQAAGETPSNLIYFFLYMSVASTFCPLPTAPPCLMLAEAYHPLIFATFLVASVGAIASAIANMHDYHILTYTFKFRPVDKIRQTRTHERSVRWFNKAPFITIAVASFLPLPIDVIRMLAISAVYPKMRFFFASLVGRWPRYAILAVIGYEWKPGWKALLAIVAASALAGLLKLLQKKGCFSRRKPA
ncbi:MAG: VTT domain-containing protein [Candidatus Tritonobacter lacicola]|nr:VTT domain-containing protein [Candidatus Tritonobacter lacicola]